MIVQSKLQRPALPGSLLSRQLSQRLELSWGFQLNLVIAPAGFGKSTLILQWLEQRQVKQPQVEQLPDTQRTTAWLALDSRDNHPQTFWLGVIAALQLPCPGLGQQTGDYLRLPDLPPCETYLTPLLHDLALHPQAVMLILDDYHLIENPEIHQGLSHLLLQAPPHFHLMLSTRHQVQALPVARLRAKRQVFEIGTPDLRFGLPEMQALFAQQALDLNSDVLAELYATSEGWPLCLQLLLMCLEQNQAQSQTAETWVQALHESQQYVLDYLLDEVFERLPADWQDFLQQISVLVSLNASLCQALTGRADSATLLADLTARNLFVIALDAQRNQYRLHPLFAELLQQRLSQRQPQAAQELYLRAMQWSIQQGEHEQAMHYGLKAQDFSALTALLCAQAYPMMAQGQIVKLDQYLAQFPPAVLAQSDDLKLFELWVLILSQDMESAQNKLLDLPETEKLRPHRENLLATLARKQGKSQAVIEHSMLVLQMLPDPNGSFEQDFILGTAWFNLGIGHLLAQNERESLSAFENSLPFQHRIHNFLTALAARVCQARIYLTQGQLDTASFLYHQALQDAENWHLSKHSLIGTVWVDLALHAYYLGQKESGLALLDTGLKQTREAYNTDSIYGFKMALELYCRWQEWALAQDCLVQAENFARKRQAPAFLAQLDSYRRWIWLGQKQWDLLDSPAKSEAKSAEKSQSRCATLVQVYWLLHRRQNTRALAELSALWQAGLAQEHLPERLEILLLQALAWEQEKQEAQVIAHLSQALALCSNQAFAGIWSEHSTTLTLLKKYQGQFSAQAQALIQRLWPGHFGTEAPTESLSLREIELLQLIEQGLSNQALAERLVVSLNTIKTHLKNVFRKLGVSSRTQALAKARQMGVIGEEG